MKIQQHSIFWGSCSRSWRILINTASDRIIEGDPVGIIKEIKDDDNVSISDFLKKLQEKLASGKLVVNFSGNTEEEMAKSFLEAASKVGMISVL